MHSQTQYNHKTQVTKMPPGFFKIAHTSNSEHAAIACPAKQIYGLQFHPEVTHSLGGLEVRQ